jgi:hypothetical protein
MLHIALLLASCIYLHAGVIQGIVLEHTSGRPVARTTVRLNPVPAAEGTAVEPVTTRAGRSGQFLFTRIPPGSYFVTAYREGYFPAAHGQRRPLGRGMPIHVTADSTLFTELRLRQKGAITGRVLDENGVPAPHVRVLAYRARLPLRSAGSALSDDRGVYRIHGLELGKYWVRSAAHVLDDNTGWIPTFGPQGRETKDARLHVVAADGDTAYADVSPETGQLFRLGGLITCASPATVNVTVSSETGQMQAQTFCGVTPGTYRFDGLAAGNYEIFAMTRSGDAAGFLELTLGGNMESAHLTLTKVPVVEVNIRRSGSQSPENIPLKLVARRQNLSETEIGREITEKRIALPPGYWEFRAVPAAGYFAKSIDRGYGLRGRRRPERMADRFELFIDLHPQVQSLSVIASDAGGQLTGRVVSDGKAVEGVPVYLWPDSERARRSLAGWQETMSDTAGRFRFETLPPGEYRVLASFDVYELDGEIIELSRAPSVKLEPKKTAEIDLPVWLAPY